MSALVTAHATPNWFRGSMRVVETAPAWAPWERAWKRRPPFAFAGRGHTQRGGHLLKSQLPAGCRRVRVTTSAASCACPLQSAHAVAGAGAAAQARLPWYRCGGKLVAARSARGRTTRHRLLRSPQQLARRGQARGAPHAAVRRRMPAPRSCVVLRIGAALVIAAAAAAAGPAAAPPPPCPPVPPPLAVNWAAASLGATAIANAVGYWNGCVRAWARRAVGICPLPFPHAGVCHTNLRAA
jgi:hypothetical protein